MSRYPNKNIGRWEDYGHVAQGAPDGDDDIQCEAEMPVPGRALRWIQCENLVPEWDGDEPPLCEEHSEAAQQSEVADLQRKQQKEDDIT